MFPRSVCQSAALVNVWRCCIRLPAWFIASFLGAALILQPASLGANNESVELHVKAAYLLHFVRYVYWPDASPAVPSSPVVLGVLGHDPMVEVLVSTISGKTVNNRPIRVKVFSSADEIDHCDILFVPRSESKQLPAVLAAISGRPTLTVSDKERFSNEGGMIEFLLVDDTVRFTINNQAAERAGLKLSSELLRVAYSIIGRHK
jgi:hypothetical protein